MRKILLRAFEFVNISFSHITFSQYLPSSEKAASASSSATDLSVVTPTDDECYTLSLDVSDIACQLSAADSTNNDRARNAFGTNPNPESKVRGVGFGLQWRNVALQCLAPGEQVNDKSQLIAIRQAEIDGLSTWRPGGWTREELLFANDPNLALIVFRGSIASIDVAGDVQLFDELSQASKRHRPDRYADVHESSATTEKAGKLPPRIRMVLDIGHAMVLAADKISENQTTLSLASDGLHLQCFTGFSDILARRRDKATNRLAFKQEDELRQRREEAGPEADYALSPSMLKPQLRRYFSQTPAKLQEDYAISMGIDASLALEPTSLHMTLSGKTDRDQRTYRLASIGRIHGMVTGDILVKQDIQPDSTESAHLDFNSLSCGCRYRDR